MSADDPSARFLAFPKGLGVFPDDPATEAPAVPDDPAAPESATTIGELARTITEDPIPLVVAEIHVEIRQLLHMHRELYDGIELATEQVQDKRIELLEAGPEVTVAGVFLEFALGFFLDSPLLKIALRRAFRFAGDAAKAVSLASRRLKLERLKSAAAGARRRLDNRRQGLSKRLAGVRELLSETLHEGTREHYRRTEVEILVQLRTLDFEGGNLAIAARRARTAAQEQSDLTHERLREFLQKTQEIAIEYGVGVAKATKRASDAAARDKSVPNPSAPVADAFSLNSAGVQIKMQAQRQLRDMELYLGLVAADADLIRSIAQSDPWLVPDCYELLSNMLDILHRHKDAPEEIAQQADIKQSAMFEFEKLIWALLVADAFPQAFQFKSPTSADTMAAAMSGPGAVGGLFLGTLVAQESSDPPARLRAYLRARFFSGENLSDEEIFVQLQEMKRNFLEASEEESLFTVVKPAVFKGSS